MTKPDAPAPDVEAIMALAEHMAMTVAHDWQDDTYEQGGPQDTARASLRAAVERVIQRRDQLEHASRDAIREHLEQRERAERAKQEAAALRKDAERIDFLHAEAQKHQVMFAKSLYGTGIEIALGYRDVRVVNGDLRAAIDAAMKEGE